VTPFGSGLINRSFLVEAVTQRFVLQRVSPIFSPEIHDNIAAVTRGLEESGLVTPRLVPTREGGRYVRGLAQDGTPNGPVWRLLTYIDGVAFDVVATAEQAHAAGALVARFHRALDRLDHVFVGMRLGIHDTPAHLARLTTALSVHGAHRLASEVLPLGREISSTAADLPPLPELPARVCHGDLKFNNILFAGATPPQSSRALCLVDLDTVGPMPLAAELGDAWRSWCNRAGEDVTEAQLDLSVFAASLDGYCTAFGRDLSADERRALLLAPEWFSLELSARFAADALNESYFGWSPERFATRGEHNLVRARGQWSLFEAFHRTRPERARALGLA
jgi:Ser/Thr protein kinase RdoA (MazF antagonist)